MYDTEVGITLKKKKEKRVLFSPLLTTKVIFFEYGNNIVGMIYIWVYGNDFLNRNIWCLEINGNIKSKRKNSASVHDSYSFRI